jgi:glycosyltransferase involved in cell wall biosynthesis
MVKPTIPTNKRFLLTQRACIEFYPPVLHQAALLSAVGEVTIVDTFEADDGLETQTAENIRRVRVAAKQSPLTAFPIFSRIQNLRRYGKAVRREIIALPDLMIAYEPEAAWIMLRSGGEKIKRIVHLHETPTADAYASSRSGSIALRYLVKNLGRAYAVVVPDHDRAAYLQELASLKVKPLVVMNCPRRLPELPISLLIPFLRERGINSSKIVHYQGSVGSDHQLEVVIKSMRFWPTDAVFVIVGGSREEYRKKLVALAIEEGLERRVVFTGRIPYSQIFQYAVGASVGVTLLDPAALNWKLSAGASNKRFEYIALGIPQVTNDGPGIRDLFCNTGIAAIANPHNAEDVGRKISRYLIDEASSREAGAKARAIHLQSYNYEQEFQKVLELIQ